MANEELQQLKQRAKLMGIKFPNNIGLEALKSKVNGALESGVEEEEADVLDEETEAPVKKTQGLSVKALRALEKKSLKLKMSRLVRIRLSSNNPAHQKHQGYLANVGNAEFGQYKKFIPYDTEWHVPYFVFQNLKNERFFQAFVEKRNMSTGRKTKKSVIKKEFVLEQLSPLTIDELKALAAHQSASMSIGDVEA